MEHSPRWGTTGTDTKWEARTRGNENEGGHTGSGPDRSYPELTGVVSERVLTGGHFLNVPTSTIGGYLGGYFVKIFNMCPVGIWVGEVWAKCKINQNGPSG